MTGPLHPDAFYRLSDIREMLGIDEETVSNGRREDFLHPIKFGRCLFYEGREIVAWIKAKGTVVRSPKGYVGRVHAKQAG